MKTHHSSAHDFDFFTGHWRVAHRQLKQRLAGCTEWVAFDGSCKVSPLLGGAGNIDDNLIDHPSGAYRAATLRAFDPATATWSIWWLDGRFPARVDVPMVGSFDDGQGEFLCDDVFNGAPIKVRFRWRADPQHPRWEQAFSGDAGATWETNWIMYFERSNATAA